MDKDQLRDLITRVLKEVNLYTESAVELLMLTASVESKLGYYVKQMGGGPARGIFQMEPTTYNDILDNFVHYKPQLQHIVVRNVDNENLGYGSKDLEWNIYHAIVMARLHYLRVKAPLPNKNDLRGMASYWKKHYNTYAGKGTVEKAVKAYKRYAA